MCWWKISQPCVPHCLHSWKYTSTSPNFLFCWKPKFLNSCWSEGKLKPIGWGESISANRQPGKNNVPIDAGVIQFVSVGTSCHNVTDSQCDYEALGVYSVYIVCIIVELLYSITFRFLFLQFRFVCPGRWFPTSLSDGRCAFFMAPKDGPSCVASGGGEQVMSCLDRFIFTACHFVCHSMYLFI